ncbi:peptide chain release factor N(5)-glutamine methyltransferase [Candidatus Uabimicrobium sp. HlEnr_7]|uniref:peptide chain release factor N(5)-glutamine methyltransferase n=1 Tax=Candidatus Uabimicrobium helgolandensis TaxID=3095367 RepID=UPI003558030E
MKIITKLIYLLYPEKNPRIGNFLSFEDNIPCISLTSKNFDNYKKKSFDALLVYQFTDKLFELVKPGGFIVAEKRVDNIAFFQLKVDNYFFVRKPCDEKNTLSIRAAITWCNLALLFTEDSSIESRILVSQVLKVNTSFLYTFPEKKLSLSEDNTLESFLRKRQQRIPISYILQNKNFMSLPFYVNKDVLIPRPETELIVEYVIKNFKNKKIQGLDIATGSGCIAISILYYLQQAQFIASDLSFLALQVAQKNAHKNNVQNRIYFVNGDMLSPFKKAENFDIIISNPPYISFTDYQDLQPEVKHEPQMALTAKEDGYYFYRDILQKACVYLKPGGELILEMGHLQSTKIKEMIFSPLEFKEIMKDYAGIDRVIVVKKI